MKKLIIFIVSFLLISPLYARGGGGGGSRGSSGRGGYSSGGRGYSSGGYRSRGSSTVYVKAYTRRNGYVSSHLRGNGRYSFSTGVHRSTYARGIARDSRGRIARSSSAKHDFMRETGYLHGRSGYEIDHIVPLKCGGADSPSNMQWLSKSEHLQKTKAEEKEHN